MLRLVRSLWPKTEEPTYRWIDLRSVREAETAEDLAGKDLAGKDLAGKDLAGKDLAGKDLAGTDETLVWYPSGKATRQYLRRRPRAHIVPADRQMLPALDDLPIEDPPVFAVAASHCRHVGFRTILARDGTAFNDDFLVWDAARRGQAARFNSNIPNTDERTPLRAAEDLSEVRLTAKLKRPVRKIRGTTFVLTTDEPTNYGSFLFRVTPKLLTWKAMNLKGTLLVPAHYASMRDYWSMLGLGDDDYVCHDPGETYELERAIVIGNRNPQAFLDPDTVELHRGVARPHFAGRPRRLFVSREALPLTKTGYRRMVNADRLAEALTREGFETITPETMPMAAQIEAFAAADIVIGQSGGAMFNCAFCKPGTRVIDIESEPHWIHAHLCFMTSLDLSVSIFEGQTLPCERPYHLPFEVDVDALIDHVRALTKA